MPRRSFTGSTVDTSAPSTVTVPEVGSIIRLITRSAVVLPQPEEPAKTVSGPLETSRLKWSTATAPSAYTLVAVSKLINLDQFLASLSYGMVETVVPHPAPCRLVGINPGVARHRGIEFSQSRSRQLR